MMRWRRQLQLTTSLQIAVFCPTTNYWTHNTNWRIACSQLYLIGRSQTFQSISIYDLPRPHEDHCRMLAYTEIAEILNLHCLLKNIAKNLLNADETTLAFHVTNVITFRKSCFSICNTLCWRSTGRLRSTSLNIKNTTLPTQSKNIGLSRTSNAGTRFIQLNHLSRSWVRVCHIK